MAASTWATRFMDLARITTNSPTNVPSTFSHLLMKYKKKPCFIMTLPDEILTYVLCCLPIEDVAIIRTVNRLFYQVSLQPIIWKRALRLMNITPPPLPPSKRYKDLENLTGFEAERMVIRAISFHNNWKSEAPKVYGMRSYMLHHNVLSMVVLPGGKHLVASVADYTYTHYFLMVLVMDYRHGGLVPLAKVATDTKAYNVRAKYMTVRGTAGIVIGYTRREFHSNARVSAKIDPSIYADTGDIDPPFPLRYECTCLMVSLDTLEELADPKCPPGSAEYLERAKAQPPPFVRLSRIRSHSQLDAVDLADIRGEPHVAVVKKPETIMFKNLDTGVISSLTIRRFLGFENTEHDVMNFRIMPYHGDLLAMVSAPIVSIAGGPLGPRKKEGILYACIFVIPDAGVSAQNVEPFEARLFENRTAFESIQISDPVLPARLDRSIRPSSTQAIDPPVCIYYRNMDTCDLTEMRIRPCRPDSLQPLRNTFFESLKTLWRTRYQINVEGCSEIITKPLVLPGHSHPLIWTTSQADRTHSPLLYNFYSQIRGAPGTREKEWDLEDDVIDMDDSAGEDEPLEPIYIKQKRARDVSGAPIKMPKKLRHILRNGIKALAWDDWTGRIFVATLDDCMIYVMELGQGPKEDSRGQRMPIPLADDRMIDR